MKPTHGNLTSPDRRGAVMIMALATLAIVGLVAAAMFRSAILARRGLRGEHAARQVETLLDAAAARARARLAAGRPVAETLELGPADLGAAGSAVVVVTAEPAGDRGLRVRIVAEYPREGPVPVSRTREILVRSPSPSVPDADQETTP
jgi:type II secretory pathway pseudopilin PulG